MNTYQHPKEGNISKCKIQSTTSRGFKEEETYESIYINKSKEYLLDFEGRGLH